VLDTGPGLRRISHDGEHVRWAFAGRFFDAITVGDDVIGVGTIGKQRVAFRIGGDGRVRWQTTSDVIAKFGSGLVVRVGATTVIANGNGEVAIDDAGRVIWQHARDPTEAVAMAVVPGGIAIATMGSPAWTCVVRLLDPATGGERATAEVPGTNNVNLDVVALGERIVVRVQDVVTKLTVLDARTAAVLDRFDEPMVAVTDDARPKLGATEVAYVERYASGQQGTHELALRIVDIATHRARRISLFELRVSTGTGMNSTAQLKWAGRTSSALVFAGLLDGELGVGGDTLRGPVAYVDECEAAGYIECTLGGGKTMVSDFIGLFGSVELAPTH
jgi:hypothetical protein